VVRTVPSVKPAASSALPLPGTLFAVPLADGRYGMARVLAHDAEAALLAVTPWIGTEPELAGAFNDPRAKQVLSLTHHEWSGTPQVLWVTGAPPKTWRPLGVLAVDPSEIKPTSTYGNWDSAEIQPLEQWRWDHERDKFPNEDRAKKHAKVRLSRLRAARRKKETLPALLRKHWFRAWDPALAAPAKKVYFDSVKTLSTGKQPKETQEVLDVMRACIEELNRLSLSLGGTVFGQPEREDLVEALLRMGLAAGVEQPAIESVIDASRTW